MKKKILSACSVFFAVIAMIAIILSGRPTIPNMNSFPADFASRDRASVMYRWGQILCEDSKESSGGDKIYAQGKDAVITEKDMSKTTEFYKLTGMDKEDARAAAEKYLMEYEALYSKAIAAGFDVTDQEVAYYVNAFRSFAENSDNRADLEAVISAFDNADDYWDYQLKVYKKSLPIQKYIEKLRQDFFENGSGGESDDISGSSWNEELKLLKRNAVEEQHYHPIGDGEFSKIPRPQ